MDISKWFLYKCWVEIVKCMCSNEVAMEHLSEMSYGDKKIVWTIKCKQWKIIIFADGMRRVIKAQ